MGTRLLGAQIRADLRPLLDGKEKVVLDFSGIDTVTNSFADECIAKLLLEMSLDELKAKTTFTGLTPMTERSILTALKRRQIYKSPCCPGENTGRLAFLSNNA